MKKFSFVICILALLLTGCSLNKSVENSNHISAYIDDTEVKLQQVDISTDNLLENNTNDNTDFEAEKKIFSPLLDSKTNAEINDEITLKFDKKYQDVIVYDHLLTEDGCSYFNKSINQYNLTLDNDTAKIKLSEHSALLLSSDSSFLKTGEIRGFRIVFEDSDDKYEYSFLIKVKK